MFSTQISQLAVPGRSTLAATESLCQELWTLPALLLTQSDATVETVATPVSELLLDRQALAAQREQSASAAKVVQDQTAIPVSELREALLLRPQQAFRQALVLSVVLVVLVSRQEAQQEPPAQRPPQPVSFAPPN
jgi:hypothetical protein